MNISEEIFGCACSDYPPFGYYCGCAKSIFGRESIFYLTWRSHSSTKNITLRNRLWLETCARAHSHSECLPRRPMARYFPQNQAYFTAPSCGANDPPIDVPGYPTCYTCARVNIDVEQTMRLFHGFDTSLFATWCAPATGLSVSLHSTSCRKHLHSPYMSLASLR